MNTGSLHATDYEVCIFLLLGLAEAWPSFSLGSLAKRLHGFDEKYCYLKKEKNFKQEVPQVISLFFPMWLIIECCGVITDKRLAGGYQVLCHRDYDRTTPSPNCS